MNFKRDKKNFIIDLFEAKQKTSFLSILSVLFIFSFLLGSVSAFTQVYDFTTNPSSLTTNLAYYPITGRVLSTTKAVYVNYDGFDHNVLIDSYALDYFVVIPLNAGINNVTIKLVGSNNEINSITKQVIYDSTYSTEERELIYANTNYYLLPDIAHHFGVLVVDSKRNSFLGIIPDKTIQGLTPDGTKMVLNGEWYLTSTNSGTGVLLPNYVNDNSNPYKILFSNDGYAYYNKYKLNLNTNQITQLGSFNGFRNIASLSSDGGVIAFYNNSSNQGFLNTSTFKVTSANFNPNKGYFFNNLEISPNKDYVISTTSGNGGGIAILQYSNLINYNVVEGCEDWAREIKFSPDNTKLFVGCNGNSYYGGGGVKVIDLASFNSNGEYPIYGAGSVTISQDGRVFNSSFVTYNSKVTGNVNAHGIYELSLNPNGVGFNADKVFFVNLVGNVSASLESPNWSNYKENNIFIKEGTVICNTNNDCGTNNQIGNTFCQSNSVYTNYNVNTCNNPGTQNSYCSSVIVPQLKETCVNGCSGGVCNTNFEGIQIVNGKIRVEGVEFLIRGVDYAPWLDGTGPSSKNWQNPFPQNRNVDVTSKVMSGGKVNVTDYSKDGKIQAWEVIRFDVETMKQVGANTIRTYATAHWHDKDLDGAVDSPTTNVDLDELKQGDLPDWVVSELLTQANANNMKVILGYWVEEENFKENPFVANWDDLQVAKQAIGFMMNKYKSNPAVLAWGIGNEVNGVFNQGWFSWGVNVNDYLNELFAHARMIDSTHPIIYAKYIGENANFNTLTADIISINAFTHSAQELIDYGMFDIPAPSGKAYMLGEFGHILNQAEAHWELSKVYAGGAFLEYNNVWWKGDGHDVLGIVDKSRAINAERYNELNRLFKGNLIEPVCNNNSDCGTNIIGAKTCDGKNVVRINTSYTCSNPGTQSANCSTNQQTEIVQTCSNTCSNGACINSCSSALDCGVNTWLNTFSCKSKYVKDMYRTFKCFNPGKANSYCTFTDTLKTRQTCLSSQICHNGGCITPVCKKNSQCNDKNPLTLDVCENPNTIESKCTNTLIACASNKQCGLNGWLEQINCDGKKIIDTYRTYKCVNPGKINSYCTSIDVLKTRKTCASGTVCYEGDCIKPVCSKDSSCGKNGIGKKVCIGNNVVQPTNEYTCINPNTPQAYCDNQQSTLIVENCVNGCSNGKCLPPQCGFSDGIIVSAQVKSSTVWDISKIEIKVSYKINGKTKSTTFLKNGNEIYSSEGDYAVTNFCGSICNWVEGNQVIIGANNSNPDNWGGGKISWKFDLGDINPSTITKVITNVYMPNSYGKGLHSPLKTGEGVLKLEDITLANLTTKKSKCGNDWFAHSCSKKSFSYSKTINSKTCFAS